MSRPFAGVALSVCALLAACAGDDLSSSSAEAVVVSPVPIVVLPPLTTVPRVASWDARDPSVPLWRTGVESAIVVIGPSTIRGHFTAYGVDIARSRIAWV